MQTLKKMTDKNTLSNILTMCLNNKTIKNFSLINKYRSKISNFNSAIECELIDNQISLKAVNYSNSIQIVFLSDNSLILSSGILKGFEAHKMQNCDYNVQYDDILNYIFYDNV